MDPGFQSSPSLGATDDHKCRPTRTGCRRQPPRVHSRSPAEKRLQAPLTKWTAGLTRSPSRVDLRGCHGSPQILTASRRQKLIHRISFGPAEARGLFGCRTGSGRLAQNMEIPLVPRLFIGAGSVLQRRHCAPRRPSAPRTGTTTSGEAKDVLDWHSRRAFKIFVSA